MPPPVPHPVLASLLALFLFAVASTSLLLFRRRSAAQEAVSGSLLLGGRLRAWYFEQLRPFEEACVRLRVEPSHLTWGQLLLSLVVAACYACGMVFTGGWLLLCAGSLDILDGRLARRTGKSSVRGAFLDSVIDRYADALAFLGLAVASRQSSLLWLVVAAFFGTQMVSYVQARGEALGVPGRVGALQRPERYVLLGFGSLFGSLAEHMGGTVLGQPYALTVVVLLVLAVGTQVTTVRRALHAWRALGRVLV